MKKVVLLLLLIIAVSVAQKLIIGTVNPRKTRAFSIFSIVNFPNSQCTTLSSANTNLVMFGTCLSTDTCTANKGVADGNCASGFGVCCMFSVSSCGSTITQNLTYIQNPGFPGSHQSTGICQYNFQATSDICQIRLDYNVLQVANPDQTAGTIGSCVSATAIDSVVVTSPSGVNPPIICGFNSGQHIYFETGLMMNAGSIAFNIGTTTTAQTRTWKVRAAFIECSSLSRPPTDCLQYLTGASGAFRSFNFQATTPQELIAQNYYVCIRQEQGFCSINYSVDTTTTVNPFRIDPSPVSKRQGCNNAPVQFYILIPSAANNIPVNLGAGIMNFLSNSDTYCGAYFNYISGSNNNGVVSSSIAPFAVGVFSTNTLTMPGFPGFALQYTQVGCM